MTAEATVDRAQAEVLAGRICAAAGLAAQSECRMLELLGEFDELDAIRWFHGVKSLAHWLSRRRASGSAAPGSNFRPNKQPCPDSGRECRAWAASEGESQSL